MTNRERIFTTLHRGEPDRVPFEIGGFNREGWELFHERTGSTDSDAYFGVAKTNVHVFPTDSRLDIERFLPLHDLPRERFRRQLPPHPPAGLFTLNEWGTAFVVGSNPAYDHFVAPAAIERADTLDEVRRLPMPDFDADYRWGHLEAQVRDLKARDLVAIGSMTCTLFERTWQVRGFERLLMDFVEHPEIADWLLDRELSIARARMRRMVASGVDILYLGDDVGMQDRLIMSPPVWRRFFKGRMAALIAEARSMNGDLIVRYHSDGGVEPLIPELIEIGVEVLDPVQPECMDPAAIKRRFGDRLAFWCTFGIQHTLPFGTPDDVEREVRERIETVGRGGGLFLSPTHAIAPEVPYENIRAFVRAAERYGRY